MRPSSAAPDVLLFTCLLVGVRCREMPLVEFRLRFDKGIVGLNIVDDELVRLLARRALGVLRDRLGEHCSVLLIPALFPPDVDSVV